MMEEEVTHSLVEEQLFLKKPSNVEVRISIEQFCKDFNEKVGYDFAADLTYSVLKNEHLTKQEILTIWEIRLTLHLFADNLTCARKEAINVNNALYLLENRENKPRSLAEGIAGSFKDRRRTTPPLLPIYPLPKNEEGDINWSLIILMFRLKSIPSTSVINELHRLCYRNREIAQNEEASSDIRLRLINLSYDLVIILVVSRSYLQLICYLESLMFELHLQKKQGEVSPKYQDYLSNIVLLWGIILSLVHYRKGSDEETVLQMIKDKCGPIYELDVTAQSVHSLLYVLTTIKPSVSPEDERSSLPASVTISSLSDIVNLVYRGRITTRIICSMLGLWDIQNTFAYILTNSGSFNLIRQPTTPAQEGLDGVYDIMSSMWGKHINKVYGLE